MNVWKRARKKPVEVEFREVRREKIIEVSFGLRAMGEIIVTLEGIHYALPENDFIIRGVKGEIYPIKKEIFYETYEIL